MADKETLSELTKAVYDHRTITFFNPLKPEKIIIQGSTLWLSVTMTGWTEKVASFNDEASAAAFAGVLRGMLPSDVYSMIEEEE